MSAASANLFAWLQDAAFYRGLHAEAAALMGVGAGRNWLDAGCGPGVLTRLAASQGFEARGIDLDPEMIAKARALASERNVRAEFEPVGFDVLQARPERYDVVSASSLLVVLPDPAQALSQLMSLLKPGGALLAIEATSRMSRGGALAKILWGGLGPRGYMLAPWSAARSKRTLPVSTFNQPGLQTTHTLLLDGYVRASVVRFAA